MVAEDVTLERPNVYFEAGFAMALGRPVIWTALRGEVLHFDIRQFNFIEWDTPADLREKARDRVPGDNSERQDATRTARMIAAIYARKSTDQNVADEGGPDE